MDELIGRITEKAGINNDQAAKALEAIKEFVIEKFPMMAGAIENFLPGPKDPSAKNSSVNDNDFP